MEKIAWGKSLNIPPIAENCFLKSFRGIRKTTLINPIVLLKRRWKTTNIPSICNKFKCADQCHFSVTLVEGSFIFEKFNEYLIATQIHSN